MRLRWRTLARPNSLGVPIGAALVLALSIFGLVGCNDPHSPGAGELPLVPGAELVAHAVRTGDDNSHATFLLIADSSVGSTGALQEREVAFLHRSGWHIGHRYKDEWSVRSPDRSIWAAVGFGPPCGFNEEADALQGEVAMCASLGYQG